MIMENEESGERMRRAVVSAGSAPGQCGHRWEQEQFLIKQQTTEVPFVKVKGER